MTVSPTANRARRENRLNLIKNRLDLQEVERQWIVKEKQWKGQIQAVEDSGTFKERPS